MTTEAIEKASVSAATATNFLAEGRIAYGNALTHFSQIPSAAFVIASVADEAKSPILWDNVRTDCQALARGDLLGRAVLWANNTNPQQDKWEAVKQAAVGPEWRFWIGWYEDVLAGKPPHSWEMLHEIAALSLDDAKYPIGNEDWQQGPKHIAGMIAEIVNMYEQDAPPELSPQQALERNSNAIIAQLEALKTFVEEEILRIPRPNNISEAQQKRIDSRVTQLSGIVEAVKEMITALMDQAISPQNALVVLEDKLPKVIEAADDLASEEPEISAIIVTMGTTVEYLTKRGTPGLVAVGMAATDVVVKRIGKWRRDRKSKG